MARSHAASDLRHEEPQELHQGLVNYWLEIRRMYYKGMGAAPLDSDAKQKLSSTWSRLALDCLIHVVM